MGVFFAYSLKSAICLAAFYLFYKVLLSHETFHRFNRIALLSIMILSVLIPFSAIAFTFFQYTKDFIVELDTISIAKTSDIIDTKTTISTNHILSVILLIYLIGCTICLIRNILSLIHIFQLIRKGKRTILNKKTWLITHTDQRIAPFSWMKYVVISETDLAEAGDVILMHEQSHIHQRHTIDLLLTEFCILFQWYNPAMWLLYKELQNIHEFEADQSVLNQGINAKQYQLLLIKKAVGARLYSMANSFNHSNLKKRITMMLQKKSSSWARLKYAYVLPLVAFSVAAFAHPEISQPFEEISCVKVSYFASNKHAMDTENMLTEVKPTIHVTESTVKVPSDSVYMVVDVMPKFPGGQEALMKFIATNIKYPKNAIKKGIQGQVIINFIINKDGSIRDMQITRGVDPELNAEALRVIKAMPIWTPGKHKGKIVAVKYTIPINFRLSN